MNVAFASSYCLSGTGIARYQRELIDTYTAWLGRSGVSDQLALVTPFNRSHRPAGLPSACAFRRSPMPGKLQRALNLGLGYPLERSVPGLQTSELIHSLDPQALATRRPWLVTIHDVAWRR
ncbi:MAG: hypothetical protein NTW83_01550, partial [Cyanobacteria bacterium]|nr:hypothetical protein [Cyanobacteriota bacterium]